MSAYCLQWCHRGSHCCWRSWWWAGNSPSDSPPDGSRLQSSPPGGGYTWGVSGARPLQSGCGCTWRTACAQSGNEMHDDVMTCSLKRFSALLTLCPTDAGGLPHKYFDYNLLLTCTVCWTKIGMPVILEVMMLMWRHWNECRNCQTGSIWDMVWMDPVGYVMYGSSGLRYLFVFDIHAYMYLHWHWTLKGVQASTFIAKKIPW